MPNSQQGRHLRRRARQGLAGALLAAAVACADSTAPAPPIEPPPAGKPELTIRSIQRLPELQWVEGSADPAREGWPRVGEEVIWRAHVRSWGGDTLRAEYRWSLDGAPVDSGTIVVPPGGTATASLPWRWTFERHRLRFEVDPENRIAEESETNNVRELFTDALSIGLYVEKGFYDFYRAHIAREAPGWTSFEDWAHGHVERANDMFAAARYAETPDGVLDRWRIDRITVVPDGTGGGGGWGYEDRSVDLIWGFAASWANTLLQAGGSYSPIFAFNGAFIHELGHARGLIDVYRWNLFDGYWGTRIDVREGGRPVLGTRLFPGEGPVLINRDSAFIAYLTPEQGLMNDEYDHIDRYSAIVLNQRAGERPRFGNHNCPLDCGAYMADIPRENRLVVTDSAGAPLAGAEVWLWKATTQFPWETHYGGEPTLRLHADADGAVLLGPDPFGTFPPAFGSSQPAIPRRHAIVRVAHGGRIGYAVFESRLANLEYWRGNVDLGRYTLAVRLADPL